VIGSLLVPYRGPFGVCASSTGTTNFWIEQWTTVDRMYSRRLDPEDSA
jgi:hypothetical protein